MGVERRTLRLSEPHTSAHGSICARELFTVSLAGADGVVGYGEAAPLQAYDGVSPERVTSALERYRGVIRDLRERDLGERGAGASVLDACREADALPQALAGIDLALWDMAGKREGKPVSTLLSESALARVQVNATLAATDRAGAAKQAAAAVADGFSTLKLKVGIGDDAGRVAAVRAAAGQDAALRLDANGAWDVDQAQRAIDHLAPVGLELVEEPCSGIDAVRQLRERVPVRIAIDETAAQPGALGAGAADAVCLKISRCGGISSLLAAASLVRSTGAEVYLASTLDGPLGIAAALHAAAALASQGPLAPCGLATLSMFQDLENPLEPCEGWIDVPACAGLGIAPL